MPSIIAKSSSMKLLTNSTRAAEIGQWFIISAMPAMIDITSSETTKKARRPPQGPASLKISPLSVKRPKPIVPLITMNSVVSVGITQEQVRISFTNICHGFRSRLCIVSWSFQHEEVIHVT